MATAFPLSTPVSAGSPSAHADVHSASTDFRSASSDVFSQSLTWEEAFRESRFHLQATHAKETQQYYEVQVGGLIRWATAQDMPFSGFGKRHMDRFLAGRTEEGKAPLTLHHAAVCAKASFRWCQKNEIVSRSLLADYQVRHAPRPAQYMPTDAAMQTLLKAVPDFWNPAKNPSVRFYPVAKRVFHRDRDSAILLGLFDSASRIGEILSLKVDDYRAKERQIVIRESKGREPRTLPVSPEWVEALKRITTWAKISEHITLHSLRRYSLNRLAKVNLLATRQIAGHKDTRTTLLYTKLDLDFLRGVHTSGGVVRDILGNKRVEKRKRLV